MARHKRSVWRGKIATEGKNGKKDENRGEKREGGVY